MSSGVVRSTALRAGGACVRCRKGKTKCVYENGRAPCKNCAKGMHECYLPSESMAHHHGQSPARHSSAHRAPRESLPASGAGPSESRQPAVGSANASSSSSRHVPATVADKLTPDLLADCERVVSKTFPACVAFHKPSFVQQLKSASLESSLVYALLTCAARSSPALIRRYGSPTAAAEYFASKAIGLITSGLDHPNLADIQALCLLIIHEWGTRNAVRAYIFLGQAARMLQMYRILNSHRAECDQFLQDESLRRTFWLVYILDCLLTSTPGRYTALSMQDCATTPLPCSDINFAFGNAVQVKTLGEQLDPAHHPPAERKSPGDVGEFGHIVLASTIWRDVISMLTRTNLHNFREEDWTDLITQIEGLRGSLPMQFVDKPGQINLHMTMGSGYTFAMLHCLLHCANVFVHRRRLLQEVSVQDFDVEAFKLTPRCHDIIDHLFTSSHAIISLMTAVESGSEKDHLACFPIFMLFSAFTASATIAYLSLKRLTPPTAVETAAHIVEEGLHFMSGGQDCWPLMASWARHLTVMQRVLTTDAAKNAEGANNNGSASNASITSNANNATSSESHQNQPPLGIVKDEVSSNADTNPDAMDYEHGTSSSVPPPPSVLPPPRPASEGRGESEPPMSIPRRPGITTINGNSGGTSTPAVSPPNGPVNSQYTQYNPEPKQQTPDAPANGSVTDETGGMQDMTGPELCSVFERQLLEMDDLAAFMGGGV